MYHFIASKWELERLCSYCSVGRSQKGYDHVLLIDAILSHPLAFSRIFVAIDAVPMRFVVGGPFVLSDLPHC